VAAGEAAAGLIELLARLTQAHPWHGIKARPVDGAEGVVNAFVELVPTDTVKYELDKQSGHLRLDRPQRFSSLCPTFYGLIPQTLCGPKLGARCAERTGLTGIQGDGDPMDICIVTEKTAAHGNFLAHARPIGGLRMIDGQQADDKIIAVLEADLPFGGLRDVSQLPAGMLERLQHYFLTYKQGPKSPVAQVKIAEVYGAEEAFNVIAISQADYCDKFGHPEDRAAQLAKLLG
jgi:inorganic pyrophosphatase